MGPSFDTTSVGENIIFRPSVTWKRDKQEGKDVKEGDGGVVPGGGIDTGSLKQQLKDKKVKCRICDGEHYTMKCPFKDTLAPDGVDGAVGGAAGGADGMDGDAAGSKEGGLGTASGVYVPVHLRKGGAGATGEKMGGKYERDDLATLRVTNVSVPTFQLAAGHWIGTNSASTQANRSLFPWAQVSEMAEENDLREIFERFGRVTRVFLAKDRETGRAKGFAFISFQDRTDAAKACEKIDGCEFDYPHFPVCILDLFLLTMNIQTASGI